MAEGLPLYKPDKKLPVDGFLSTPSQSSFEQENKIDRLAAHHANNSARFRVAEHATRFTGKSKTKMGQGQQSHGFSYNNLTASYSALLAHITNIGIDDLIIVPQILHVKPGQQCVVTGTLYKEMSLKPDVLKEYAKERSILPVPVRDSYVSDKDTLVLEDETGRVKLVGENIGIASLITGIVVSVKGLALPGGDFEVEDFCIAELPPQPDLPLSLPDKKKGGYVAIASGLEVGADGSNPLALQVFVDYISGLLGSAKEQQFISRITRLILAGNSLCSIKQSDEGTALLKYHTKKQINEVHDRMAAPIRELDLVLSQLAAYVATDIMPGEYDPATYVLPQNPLNSCLLPLASKYNTCTTVSNPYESEIAGRIFLGTSGQPINNIAKYTDTEPTAESRLDLMEKTLRWRHIAPSGPDTLAVYPYKDEDPFILEQCPHVYFTGNQPEFGARVIHGDEDQTVLVLSVPCFARTHTFVVVNLETLEALPVTINVE